MPYIPLAHAVKTSITSCLCSGFHLLHFSMRINSELDIILDIPHLSILVVYGYGTEGQGFKDNLDVGLGVACNAYTQVRES